ncbi:diguanylate cyclase [Billgrantia gudaonensis]|uniref:diguanylate cyclase n=1 Tax=Billgrantia gudaonensis TaxID=376427 RepID=A0A3S0QFU4_9GAMM|nr:diguanylate cyclase [Halomonas gudaonensis]
MKSFDSGSRDDAAGLSWPSEPAAHRARRLPEAGRVTASFGVAASEPEPSLDTLMVRADRAMYAAKCQGRNRASAQHGSSASAS